MPYLDGLFRTFGSIAWIFIAIIYLFTWYILEQIGVIYLFAHIFIQPLLPPDRDAHILVSIVGWLILGCMGGAAADKK